MRNLIFTLALLPLMGCGTAPVVEPPAVVAACADVSAVQPLLPLAEAVASAVPGASAIVIAANAAVNGACMDAPAVNELINQLKTVIAAKPAA